jgi:hypothetical protein
VSKPDDFCVRAPIPDGDQATNWTAYGTGLHVDIDEPFVGNDYYALDLTIGGYANGGKGRPIVAAASGTVRLAGWATEGWASFGMRVVIEHDFVDAAGHKYYSNYAHMDSVTVSQGQKVTMGQQLGTLGGSSNGSKTGTSYHLHFSFMQDGTVGGSGTGGHFGGRTVVPEPLGGGENFVKQSTMQGMVPACAQSVPPDDPPDDPPEDPPADDPNSDTPDAGVGDDVDDGNPDDPPDDIPPGWGQGQDAGVGPAAGGDLYASACSAAGAGDLLGAMLLALALALALARKRLFRSL